MRYLIFFSILLWSCKSDVGDSVIYGTDNRREPYQVSNGGAAANLQKVGALMDMEMLQSPSQEPFGAKYQLCGDEPYWGQPVNAFCTAFAVNDTTVVTAGHCIDATNYMNTLFVFGYQMGQNGFNDIFEVHEIRSIKKRAISNNGLDFCVLGVWPPVAPERQVKINTAYRPRKNTKVYVIGHPCGLPLKFCSGAEVRNKYLRYFSTNLDTYGGNSGSPVFNQTTHLVEGVLVRGENDFVKTARGCWASNRCQNNTCRGEDVVYIDEISKFFK